MAELAASTGNPTGLAEPDGEGRGRIQPAQELKAAALRLFAINGYSGTSLQLIAETAGFAKSSVLYHFSSKEVLLEEMLSPVVDRLEALLGEHAASWSSAGVSSTFIHEFVELILGFRYEINIFINQGQSLADIPIVARANALVTQLSNSAALAEQEPVDRLRFAVALGGAAYSVVAGMRWLDGELPVEQAREGLVRVMSELLGQTEPH